MSGKFIISLDFELMWGVRDHRSVADYGDAVLGVRKAIPGMLARFENAGVRATWATVGLLFARNRDEIMDHLPIKKPSYTNRALSPYTFIESGLGADEASDPYHFGASLVDRIIASEGQELACHTFSHYFCLEPGQTLDEFREDLRSATAIAAQRSVEFKSLVFPRNQWTADHVAIAAEFGIKVFRGDPPGIMYRSTDASGNTPAIRALRLADSVLPVASRNDTSQFDEIAGATNAVASRFLRTQKGPAGIYRAMHLRRITSEMERAARDGTNYHLWWHPHNFGRDTDSCLAMLDKILARYRDLHDRFGMTSSAMADFALGASAPGGEE